MRTQLNDTDGMILSHSNLCILYVAIKDFDKAIEMGEKALLLAQNRPPSRPIALALHYLIEAHGSRGKVAELYDAKRKFDICVNALRNTELNQQEINSLRQKQEIILSFIPSPSTPDVPDEHSQILIESQRLINMRQYDDAIQMIESALERYDGVEERAALLGNKANALKHLEEHETAIEIYQEVYDTFTSLGDWARAALARMYICVSLRELGQIDQATTILHEMLADEQLKPLRIQIIINLINVRKVVFAEAVENGDEELADTVIEEIESFVTQARELPIDHHESIGLVLLNSAYIYLPKGEKSKAIERLEEAKSYLIRANSHHLRTLEAMIEQYHAYEVD